MARRKGMDGVADIGCVRRRRDGDACLRADPAVCASSPPSRVRLVALDLDDVPFSSAVPLLNAEEAEAVRRLAQHRVRLVVFTAGGAGAARDTLERAGIAVDAVVADGGLAHEFSAGGDRPVPPHGLSAAHECVSPDARAGTDAQTDAGGQVPPSASSEEAASSSHAYCAKVPAHQLGSFRAEVPACSLPALRDDADTLCAAGGVTPGAEEPGVPCAPLPAFRSGADARAAHRAHALAMQCKKFGIALREVGVIATHPVDTDMLLEAGAACALRDAGYRACAAADAVVPPRSAGGLVEACAWMAARTVAATCRMSRSSA